MGGILGKRLSQSVRSANHHIGTEKEKKIHREINKYFKFYVRPKGGHLASPSTIFYHLNHF